MRTLRIERPLFKSLNVAFGSKPAAHPPARERAQKPETHTIRCAQPCQRNSRQPLPEAPHAAVFFGMPYTQSIADKAFRQVCLKKSGPCGLQADGFLLVFIQLKPGAARDFERVAGDRAIDFYPVASAQGGFELDGLAEDADSLGIQIDLRVEIENAAQRDGILDAGIVGYFDIQPGLSQVGCASSFSCARG